MDMFKGWFNSEARDSMFGGHIPPQMICGCDLNRPAPAPQRSAYIQDVSASFALLKDEKELTARYSWLVDVKRDALTETAFIEAEFENPEPGQRPVFAKGNRIEGQKVPKGYVRYYFISEPVTGFRCKNYGMTAKLYTDHSRLNSVDKHHSEVASYFDNTQCSTDEFLDAMSRIDDWREREGEKS
eukprot:Clim_evm114s128 gene=Clim_evmTU114s128